MINSHNNENGWCAQTKSEGGQAVWKKTDCASTNTKGVVCARRHNWEDIGTLYISITYLLFIIELLFFILDIFNKFAQN